MAVLSFDELIAKIKTKIGEDTSDESIELLEDVTDTFNANNDGEDWKTKYEENDKEWRKKYIDRFSGSKLVPAFAVQFDDQTVVHFY